MGTTVRTLATIEACREVVALQRAVWGFGEREVVPAHVLVTAAQHGGLVLGAFEGSRMVGMLFGFVGRRSDGRCEHVSHMAGVVREAQGRGIGSALKWAQREHVLAQHIDLVTWTFDPCEARNARFNLHHLAAVARTYHVNLYGDLADDLNRGLPSDRLQVEWSVASPRVERRAQEAATRTVALRATSFGPPSPEPPSPEPAETITTTHRQDDSPRAPVSWRTPSAPTCALELPPDMQRLKATDGPLAHEWRLFVREALTAAFDAGYTATDVRLVHIEPGDPRAYYVLTRSYVTGD